MAIDADLPVDLPAGELLALIEELERQQAEARQQAIETICTAMLAMRDEAVKGRSSSGIEQIWLEDSEMYEGVDDANRHEEGTNRTRKPVSDAGGGSGQTNSGGPRKSTVFLNIAGKYCDAAAARVGDMLLPVDDRPWEFSAGKVAELTGTEQPVPSFQGALAVESPEVQRADEARKAIQAIAERRAKKAQEKVDDWLTECDFQGQVRLMIDDAARLGSGVLKGPVPTLRRINTRQDGRRNVLERIDPVTRRIACWDLFPDPSCGPSIHNGGYVWERERYWTRKMLGAYRSPEARKDGWLPDQIEACLMEGPRYTVDGNLFRRDDSDAQDYEVWHGYAALERKDLEPLGLQFADDSEVFVPVYAVVCNDRIVKIVRNPDDGGTFPYDVFPWSLRDGMPWGRGVVRQTRTPQRIVNAACRRMLDNAGMSAGVLTFVVKGMLDHSEKTLGGNPTYEVDEGADLNRILKTVEIPSRQQELLAIIQFALKMAEDVTGVPMLMQGQQGRAPDTVGGMQILNNNANGLLRRIARLFDSYVTEPHIRRYNDWLQTYSDDPEVHGDWIIDARGSSALVERDLQNQAIVVMGQFINDPAFKVNKEKWFAEWAKSQRLDPRRFQYTDTEWERVRAAMQPQSPYQIDVARINAEARLQEQQMADAAAERREVIRLLGEEKLSADEIKARLLEIVTKDRRDRDIMAQQQAVKARYGTSVDLPG